MSTDRPDHTEAKVQALQLLLQQQTFATECVMQQRNAANNECVVLAGQLKTALQRVAALEKQIATPKDESVTN